MGVGWGGGGGSRGCVWVGPWGWGGGGGGGGGIIFYSRGIIIGTCIGYSDVHNVHTVVFLWPISVSVFFICFICLVVYLNVGAGYGATFAAAVL